MAALHRALACGVLTTVFLIVFVLRLDGVITWNWFLIFLPNWILDCIMLAYDVTVLVTILRMELLNSGNPGNGRPNRHLSVDIRPDRSEPDNAAEPEEEETNNEPSSELGLQETTSAKSVMGKARKTQKISRKLKAIKPTDSRINETSRVIRKKKEDPNAVQTVEVPQVSSALFFQYNTQLGPPFHVLLDTNFINFSVKNKLDICKSMMDCLYAKCTAYITDCVMAELEKMGSKFRVALKISKDPRFKRLSCLHKGTYADDCIIQRVTQHKCYIVATCDKDLKRRIRKLPGVPVMYISQHRYSIERMPDAFGAPRL